MVNIKTPEALRSPMDGASYEHEGLMSLLAAAGVQRQNHVHDEPSSKATMWDPVKDCSDTNTTQADLSGLVPDGHSSEQLTDSTAGNLTLTDLDSRYDHAHGDRQQSTSSGFIGAASMGPPPYPRSHTMVLGYQDRASMGSQMLQMTPSYDQSRPQPQKQSGYENGSALNQHARGSWAQTAQRSLESIARGATPLDTQPRLPHYLPLHSQRKGQPMDMKSRMPASMVSNEAARPQRSSPCRRTQVPIASPTTGHKPSTQRRSDHLGIATGHDPQRDNGPQHQNLLPTTTMSQALGVARYGESLDQQSNYTEATHVYERACALLQEAILRSGSIEERMECNIARNTYQARLNELSRQSIATRRSQTEEQDDEQEDEDLGRTKNPYSLFEDFALCHKDEEDMSWQAVAELPIFKGKRKHRSLSQRRHTISKMGGPKYHEAERPWTAQEDKKLCSMGNAGKGLGDINRIFPTRNAERCLNRYFRLKDYHTPSKGHAYASHQALQDPVQPPLGTQQHTGSSSAVARHREHRLPSNSSPYQSAYQTLPTSDRHIPSGSALSTYPTRYSLPMPRATRFPEVQDLSLRLPSSTQIPWIPSSSLASTSTTLTSWDNAASAEPRTPQLQNSSRFSTQQALATPFSFSSSSPPSAEGLKPSTPSTSTDNTFPPEAISNKSSDWHFTSTRYRPTTSSSASSGFAEDTPIFSSSDASATNSPLPKVYDSSDSQSVAVDRIRKRRRPVMDEG